MLRKTFSLLLISFILTSSNNAFSGVRNVTDDDANRVPKGVQVTCPQMGYKLTSCSKGMIPSQPCDSKYFKECICDLSIYQFSDENCNEYKTPSGSSCTYEGIKYFEKCECKKEFKICKSGAFRDAESCTDSKGIKYNICNEHIPTCESIGHLSEPLAGYDCDVVQNQYMKCYVMKTCKKR